MDKIEIPLSKRQLFYVIGCSLLFIYVANSLFFDMADRQTRYPVVFVKMVSVLIFIVASVGGIYAIVKLFDRRPGLIIDAQGIIDNISAMSVGRIYWSNITEIKKIEVKSGAFLLIFIRDPNAILERVSGIKHFLMSRTMKQYGTPLALGAVAVKYNIDDLEKLMNNQLKAYQGEMPNS